MGKGEKMRLKINLAGMERCVKTWKLMGVHLTMNVQRGIAKWIVIASSSIITATGRWKMESRRKKFCVDSSKIANMEVSVSTTTQSHRRRH